MVNDLAGNSGSKAAEVWKFCSGNLSLFLIEITMKISGNDGFFWPPERWERWSFTEFTFGSAAEMGHFLTFLLCSILLGSPF